MRKYEVNDKYNPLKVWVVKVYKCGHYYVNQKINGVMFYDKFSRVRKSSLEKAILFDFNTAMRISK